MPNFNQNLDARVQGLRGRAAWGGQAYNVFRMSNAVNNALSSSTPVITGYQSLIDHETSKRLIENETFALLVYDAVCDNRTLELGDLCQETGYGEDGGFYYLVQKRPRKPTLWIRAESAATLVTRTVPTAGQFAQMPTGGGNTPAPSGTWGGRGAKSDYQLQLVDGVYSFVAAPAATPATIQIGVQPRDRMRDDKDPNIAGVGSDRTSIARQHFILYAPLLNPGGSLLNFQPHDQFNVPGLGIFDVELIFTTGETGVTGNILICELVH